MAAGTRFGRLSAVAIALAAALPATAMAATVTVDNDGADCPSADHTSVQAGINAASPGDTVVICPGVYEEGPDTVPSGGANAVNIAKMITVKGAGADKVTIKPKATIASLLGTTSDYRNGTGAIVSINRVSQRTLVDISGITVEGNGTTAVGAGVKFWNAEGTFTQGRVKDVGTPASAQAYGVVVASNLVGDRLPVTVSGIQISGYGKAGVVLDSTQNAPQLGILATTVSGNTITGAGAQNVGPQQGVLATGLVSGSISGNVITGNKLDDGDPTTTADELSSAGIRLVDLDLSPVSATSTNTKLTATGNTIAGNAFGVLNVTGAGVDQTTPFTATGNWWGADTGPSLGLPRGVADPVNGALPGPAANSTQAVNYASFRTTAGPISPPTVPSATADAAPSGAVDKPTGSRIVRPGTAYTLKATAADDFGVKSVRFFAGAEEIGSDATAPYSAPATWTPTAALDGTEVELKIEITDSSDQVTAATLKVKVESLPVPPPVDTPPAVDTPAPIVDTPAAGTPPVTVTLVKPTKLSGTPSFKKGRKLTVSGKLTLPSGTACPVGASVRVTVYQGGRKLGRKTVKLGAGCTYTATMTVAKKSVGKKVTVKVYLAPTAATLAASTTSKPVTVKK